MIIGIDANALTRKQFTGTERYLQALLTQMMRETLREGERVVLYTSAVTDAIGELPEGWSWKVVRWPLPKGWTHGGLSLALLRNPPDVFFTPVHEVPLLHRRTIIVNTIHDVAFAVEPKTYSTLARLRQQWAVRRAIKQSTHLITVSETTKRDLQRLYGVSPAKMTATPLAIDPEEFAPIDPSSVLDAFRLYKNRYFLFVGRLEEKKNISHLLEAFFEYKKQRGVGDVTQLVLAGKPGEGAYRFEREIQESSYSSFVKRLGYISDEQKRALLQGALAYVLPSRYEGFGLPALEAFASDCPLIASDISALREVAGEAALFAPVSEVSGWARQMEQVATDEVLRQRLIDQGRQRLSDFSWEKTAKETWRVLRTYG